MKYTKKATSIAEALVVMLVITSWVTWMYNIYMQSVRLADYTANKIQAIGIAREWIEAMTNIRDTNWLFLWSDYINCWNTLNYNNLCIWDSSNSTDIPVNGSYIIYKNSNNRWYLSWATTWNYSIPDYRNSHKVWLDSDWFYTQSWIVTEIKPLFTREIKIYYIDTNSNWIDSNDEKMKITSLVQWVDSSSTSPHKVELTTVLSNYMNKK